MKIDLLVELEEKTQEFKKLYDEFLVTKEDLNEDSYNHLLKIQEKMAIIQKEIADLTKKIIVDE